MVIAKRHLTIIRTTRAGPTTTLVIDRLGLEQNSGLLFPVGMVTQMGGHTANLGANSSFTPLPDGVAMWPPNCRVREERACWTMSSGCGARGKAAIFPVTPSI